MKKEIEKIAREFLAKLLVEAEVEVAKSDEGYKLFINPKEPGILIGRNGETLKAVEIILRLMVNQAAGRFVSLLIDVAGYKEKRGLEIEEMARKSALDAKRSGRVQLLIPMNSYERRIVHMVLSEFEDIETESIGEDPNRRVMIKQKKKQLI